MKSIFDIISEFAHNFFRILTLGYIGLFIISNYQEINNLNKMKFSYYGDNEEKISQIISEFLNKLDKNNVAYKDFDDIKYDFVDSKIENEIFGECYSTANIFNNNIIYITINKQTLNNIVDLKTTIYHELGHCLLNLDHNDRTYISRGEEIPVSIMHSMNINDKYVFKNIDFYFNLMIKDNNKMKEETFFDYVSEYVQYNANYNISKAKMAVNEFKSKKYENFSYIIRFLLMIVYLLSFVFVLLFNLNKIILKLLGKNNEMLLDN